MPLFMDLHKIDGITVEKVKEAHMADLSVQDKYGVKYHQFWVNEEAGTVFCLVEGPDKKSCEEVHQVAQGNIACALVEVETGFYELFMGKGYVTDYGRVLHVDGSNDLGFRYIVAVDAPTGHGMEVILRKINTFSGRKVDWPSNDILISVFDTPANAIHCIHELRHVIADLEKKQPKETQTTFRIGVCTSQPVNENGESFKEAVLMAEQLCSIASPNQVLITSLTKDLTSKVTYSGKSGNGTFVAMTPSDESFVKSFFTAISARLTDELLSVDQISKEMGLSRSQLYRKVTSLTGRSPIDLIRDLRLDKARTLLRDKNNNVSEVALAVGYSNPSYFSRCFIKRFGCTPSRFAEELAPA